MTRKTLDPLKLLADLDEQLINVSGHTDGIRERQQQLQRDRQEIDAAVQAEHVRAARAGEPRDTAELDRRRGAIMSDTQAETDAARAVEIARRQVLRDITKLHREHRGAFIEVAEQATVKADEAMQQLATAYAAAREAYGQAEAAWADALRDYDAPAALREHRCLTVPRWPLEDAGTVLAAGPVARPPAYVPADERADSPQPGWYIDTGSGSQQVIDGAALNNPQPGYIVPDEDGFVRLKPVRGPSR